MEFNASALGIIFSALSFSCACFLLYPLQIIRIHTLIENPFSDTIKSHHGGYQVAPKEDQEGIEEEFGGSEHLSKPTALGDGMAIRSLHSRNILAAWVNLQSVGYIGLFRAVPAQMLYCLISESISFSLGSRNSITQLLNRAMLEGNTKSPYKFSPISLGVMVLQGVLMIPLDLVITRQSIGKPDGTTVLGHLRSVVRDVGVSGLSIILVPQILHSLIPALLQNLAAWCHFLFLIDFMDRPTWRILFALFELCWQGIIVFCVSAPLSCVLYRAHASAIMLMPEFSSFVAISSECRWLVPELRQIASEERRLTGKWYGRYVRVLIVIIAQGPIVFCAVLISLAVLINLGALD